MNIPYKPKNNIRIVTAASLFDGHDASINIMRRVLQRTGVEVIHLGHNRSVHEIVKAAIEEDVQGIAITSYQGGHNEFFKYMHDLLKEKNCSHIKIFGGGGGVILPQEIKALQDYGIARIYSPEDGREMGLQGMINDLVEQCDFNTFDAAGLPPISESTQKINKSALIRCMSAVEQNGSTSPQLIDDLNRYKSLKKNKIPIIGITGTGGSGKSSLTDELILRLKSDYPDIKCLIICIDPTIKKTGGALLGDRIRMNAINHDSVFMRSLATRQSGQSFSSAIKNTLDIALRSDHDLIFLETPGIGQGDTQISEVSNISIYVMTSDFGAPSQLEKISMLDYADLIAINKFEKLGSLDAYREVCKAVRRNQGLPSVGPVSHVFGTCASKFNDPGVTFLYQALLKKLAEVDTIHQWTFSSAEYQVSENLSSLIPNERQRYLSEIASCVRDYKSWSYEQAQLISQLNHITKTVEQISNLSQVTEINETIKNLSKKIDPQVMELYQEIDSFKEKWQADQYTYHVRGKELKQPLKINSLSGLKISRVALANYWDPGEFIYWRLTENVPGEFPYTAGVFPLKRQGEDPARMFAGEGDPARTNKRFHLLSQDQDANRLSTAFDSVTLYGEDPDQRPDIYGKVGESGVSICTVENMERLYAGFDLTDPKTSVSMTINGPAPIILAFFLNAAIRQQCRQFLIESKRLNMPIEKAFYPDDEEKGWTHTRSLLSDEEYFKIANKTVQHVRGTVQADILKEDQAQNTCIFSTEFALKLMADIQEWFIDKKVRNYYSVSISGYHIAEAGANPISQLAFTLANGFTYVENYLARGLNIDDFASNLSFFFSNGLDAEYQVIGRVARRIWSIAMKRIYKANESSQRLKYHIQTSGRSLHAQEIDFNDIRTTLQALLAIYDNCNSLHTNAFDEAITTPTEHSVRRALAIQMIINKEFGGAKNENPLQGSFIIDELTELVEQAVLSEFDRLTTRGGVLGAMETQYQRSKIQEESLYYEDLKHNGELPIVGVNTFVNPKGGMASENEQLEVARATTQEKTNQLNHLNNFHLKHKDKYHQCKNKLIEAAKDNKNVFAVIMDVCPYMSLGQITHTLFDVGGKYRRNL